MEPQYVVGTGYPDAWKRPTNVYPGCSCPAWRYNPRYPKPTEPTCPMHGDSTRND